MKKLFELIFVGSFLFYFTSCQGDSAVPVNRSLDIETKNLLNDLLQLELKKDSIIVSRNPIDLRFDGCLETSIPVNQELKSHFQDQYKANIDTSVWLKDSFRFSKIITQEFVLNLTSDLNNWEKFKNSGYPGFYNISKPIFSKNYNHALIRYEFICGSRCGSGTTAYCKKINGKWQVIERFCLTDY